MVFPALAGGPNTIKAQQVLFQAQKKASGNTFTARGMPLNYAVTAFIVGGGFFWCVTGLNKLYYGKGKIELK